MNRFRGVQEFLQLHQVAIPVWDFIINLMVAAFLAIILARVYVRYGQTLSNRKIFARNFLVLTTTTVFIIAVVKSSLALSLGLVGALSIVRFRAAIKEPEELAYLFLSIATGLGLGADQTAVTLVAFFVIVGMIILRSRFRPGLENQHLYLQISSTGPGRLALDQVVDVLKAKCSSVKLKRVDEANGALEASFIATFRDFSQLNSAKEALRNLDDSIKIQFLDYQGLP